MTTLRNSPATSTDGPNVAVIGTERQLEVLDALKPRSDPDRVRTAAETVDQALIEAELNRHHCVALHERKRRPANAAGPQPQVSRICADLLTGAGAFRDRSPVGQAVPFAFLAAGPRSCRFAENLR